MLCGMPLIFKGCKKGVEKGAIAKREHPSFLKGAYSEMARPASNEFRAGDRDVAICRREASAFHARKR